MSFPTRKQHLPYSQKIKILDFYHQHKHRLTQQQAVTRIRAMGFSTFAQSTLAGYLKDESQIREYASIRPINGKLKRKTSVKLPQVEEALYAWVMQKQHSGLCLTGALICEKGREFCQWFNIPEDQVPTFSNGWLGRLKTRFGLQVYKFHGEAASAPIDTIQAEIERLTGIMEPYDPNDIFNVDETALFFQLPPNQGLAMGHTAGVKADKIRLTYLLGANMSGSEKLEPLVIGRARRPQCFSGNQGEELGFYYFWNSTAWMVQSIFHKFLSDLNARMIREDQHILLIVDNASSHCHTPSDYSNVCVEFLAPNLTAWIQPMDAGIIRCFKAHYRNGFTWLALERDNAGIEKIYNINQLQAMKLAAKAWDSVKPTTIANCWRHAQLARTLSSDTDTAPADNAMEAKNAVEREAQELRKQVAQHPNLLEPEFMRMLDSLALSEPTEQELTDAEIVDGVNLVSS